MIRSANSTYVQDCIDLQCAVYPASLHEDNFAEIIAQGISLVFVVDNVVAGYLLAHYTDQIALLNAPIVTGDMLFIHDVVVLPKYRLQHVAASLINHFMKQHDETIHLVAISGAETFWQRFGFVSCGGDATSYGVDAYIMHN